MTREEYLRQLERYLKRLPKDDYDSAMEYFTEHFDDAGPEAEQRVMQELGTPKEAAAELLSNLLHEKTTAQKERKYTSVGTVMLIAVLAVFAAPIGIPLLLAAVLVLAAGLLVLAAGALCILLFGVCGLILGAKMLLRGIVAIAVSPAGAALLAGAGLLSIGASVLISILLLCVCRWIGMGLIALLRQLIARKGGTYS
ncbi:MAG: DUF1700 domain-containing protein [Butyricicoccus sp.]